LDLDIFCGEVERGLYIEYGAIGESGIDVRKYLSTRAAAAGPYHSPKSSSMRKRRE
jgi:hypothetical protein